MEEYMDIIGLNMTASDKKNFCLENSTSCITEDEIIEERNIAEATEHISNVKEEIKDKGMFALIILFVDMIILRINDLSIKRCYIV